MVSFFVQVVAIVSFEIPVAVIAMHPGPVFDVNFATTKASVIAFVAFLVVVWFATFETKVAGFIKSRK